MQGPQGKRIEVNGQVYRRVLTAGQQAAYREEWQAALRRAEAAGADAAASAAAEAELQALMTRIARECIVAWEDEQGEAHAFGEDIESELDAADMPYLVLHCLGVPTAEVRIVGRAPFASAT